MFQTIEVKIDSSGRVNPIDASVKLPVCCALLTLLHPQIDSVTLVSEQALATEWCNPDEDAAWADLKPNLKEFSPQ